ncbi:tetratricopeptide repeat protein [Rubellicoccus peritrichatus]|uniref:Outer membrane protein assembly factor BamD n=1 Tax=Rubellicoccus peritrichatus TaxID=3080537 RepID=A0AAQ3L9R3_9BACT|nr:outer membrane protein assembly factor BamD [Puniceicoccus sp. CR14]WOO41277.1 outer membrane protein assembly factor BamD [Puniceicoccus sp. CR14]
MPVGRLTSSSRLFYSFCCKTLLFGLASLIVLLHGCGPAELSDREKNDLIESGVAALEFFDFKKAYEDLSKVRPQLEEGSKQWEEVTYGLALAAWHTSPPDGFMVGLATELFQDLINQGKSPEIIAQVRLDLGRIYEITDFPGDKVNVEKAQQEFETVMKQNPGNDYGYQGMLRLAQTYVQELDTANAEKAANLISDYIARYPESEWKSVAAQYLGDIYYMYLGDDTKALEAYKIAKAAGFPNKSSMDVYIWRMGILAERTGKDRDATDYFYEIVTEYPRSVYGTYARDRVAEYVDKHPNSGVVVPELQQVTSRKK